VQMFGCSENVRERNEFMILPITRVNCNFFKKKIKNKLEHFGKKLTDELDYKQLKDKYIKLREIEL
jgi:hypothetical protein